MRTRLLALTAVLACVSTVLLAPVGVHAAAIVVVTSAGDGAVAGDGQCTLREALANVNAAADVTAGDCAAGSGAGDLVTFAIPGGGPHTIAPTTALPAVVRRVHVDGYTQPGAARGTATVGLDADLRIELSGANLTSGDGLVIAADGSIVEGLVINRFAAGAAIRLPDARATGVWIRGNYLGTDPTGATARGSRYGVAAIAGAAGNLVGTDGDGAGDDGERNLLSANIEGNVFMDGVETSGNHVAGNYIGCDATVTQQFGYYFGVRITNGAHHNVVGTDGDGVADASERNLIVGNGVGVEIDYDTHENRVAGNHIGIDATGVTALENGSGVIISGGFGNIVGTDGDGVADTAERNVIAGNLNEQVYLAGGTTANRVAGNYIGTDPSGSRSIGRIGTAGTVGVYILGSTANVVGTNGDGIADLDERNVITGNGTGVIVWASLGNVVAGNFVGTDALGTTALQNGNGINVTASVETVVGTNGDGVSDDVEGNLVSGNRTDGIWVSFDAARNRIAGNRVGSDVSGTMPLPNDTGITLLNGAVDNVIGVGATDPVFSSNLIAWNRRHGIRLLPNAFPETAGNRILGNSLHDNGGLGIDLGDDGVTPNDPGDADGGANRRQNFPTFVLLEAGAAVTVVGVPNTPYHVELFANAACDPSGYGEAETFVGAGEMTTDGTGVASFVVPLVGDNVTATATNLTTGDTSELSPCQARNASYQCYDGRIRGFAGVDSVSLRDAFGGPNPYALPAIERICNPASTSSAPPVDADHFVAYKVVPRGARPAIPETVGVVDQFGPRTIGLHRPARLLVPSATSLAGPPAPIVPSADHFVCYRVKGSRARIIGVPVRDEFGDLVVNLLRPQRFCAPADKNGESPGAERHLTHFMCYESRLAAAFRRFSAPHDLFVDNQFGAATLSRYRPTELCVPAARVR